MASICEVSRKVCKFLCSVYLSVMLTLVQRRTRITLTSTSCTRCSFAHLCLTSSRLLRRVTMRTTAHSKWRRTSMVSVRWKVQQPQVPRGETTPHSAQPKMWRTPFVTTGAYLQDGATIAVKDTAVISALYSRVLLLSQVPALLQVYQDLRFVSSPFYLSPSHEKTITPFSPLYMPSL